MEDGVDLVLVDRALDASGLLERTVDDTHLGRIAASEKLRLRIRIVDQSYDPCAAR